MTSQNKFDWERFFKIAFECQLWLAMLLTMALIITGGHSPEEIMRRAALAAQKQERRLYDERVRMAKAEQGQTATKEKR